MINADFLESSEVTTERVYQWDIGRKLKLSHAGAIAPVVHFCNKKSEKALAVETTISGDDYIASIPNSLLHEEYDIIAYIFIGNNEEAKTIKVVHIPLIKRLKPSDYNEADDENVVDVLTISAELRSLLYGLVITKFDYSKEYIKPNIVYFMGCSYICKSEKGIIGVPPTDESKWGLMCENGANISAITLNDNLLNFELTDGSLIGCSLDVVLVDAEEFNFVEDSGIDPAIASMVQNEETGVLNINETEIISKKKLLWSGEVDSTDRERTVNLAESISVGDILEVEYSLYNSGKQFCKFRVDYIADGIANCRLQSIYATTNFNVLSMVEIVNPTATTLKINSPDYQMNGVSGLGVSAKLFKVYKIIE